MDREYLDYLPLMFHGIKDFKILNAVINPFFDELALKIKIMYNNNFISTCDAQTCSILEEQYKIRPLPSDTLDDRRFRLIIYKSIRLPYTPRTLYQMLQNITGGDFELNIDHVHNKVTVIVALPKKKFLDDVIILLRKVTPMKLELEAQLKYNTHRDLSRFKHRQLSRRTHRELREEPLEY